MLHGIPKLRSLSGGVDADRARAALSLAHVTKVFPREAGSAAPEATNLARGLLARFLATRRVQAVPVVDDVSFEVKRGEVFGLLGENGSGKSTLIRMIATLLEPDAGAIRVFGRDPVAEPRAVQRLLNRVAVEASFFKKLSPLENLACTARLYDIGVSACERRVVEILAGLGFDLARLHDPMEEFSRGMQQKVAIARAFMTAPVLLLLDEPTTGLDPRSKRDVSDYIRRLRATHDATILLTTHDMAEAEALCDRAAILSRGRVVAEGTVAELVARHTAGGRGSLEEAFLALTGSPPHEEEVDSA